MMPVCESLLRSSPVLYLYIREFNSPIAPKKNPGQRELSDLDTLTLPYLWFFDCLRVNTSVTTIGLVNVPAKYGSARQKTTHELQWKVLV